MTKLRTLCAAALALTLFTALGATAQDRVYINPNHASQADVSPFSGAVLTGDTLYISGTLGLEDGAVPTDPATEARNVMNGIKAQLEDAGMTMDDLTDVQILFRLIFVPGLQRRVPHLLHRRVSGACIYWRW